MENDKLTQLHVNTKNITALVQQLQLLQQENVALTTRLRNLESAVATNISEFNQLKQEFLVMKVSHMRF